MLLVLALWRDYSYQIILKEKVLIYRLFTVKSSKYSLLLSDKVKGCLDLWHQPDLNWTSIPVHCRLFWEINVDNYKSEKKRFVMNKLHSTPSWRCTVCFGQLKAHKITAVNKSVSPYVTLISNTSYSTVCYFPGTSINILQNNVL